MSRRKPSGWHYAGVAQGRRTARPEGQRLRKVWRWLLGAFGVERPKGRRKSTSLLPRSKSQGSVARAGKPVSERTVNWVVDKVRNKRWRPISFSEGLIWLAVGAVSLAFLVLMAKGTLLLAVAIFLLLAAFAWRELGER